MKITRFMGAGLVLTASLVVLAQNAGTPPGQIVASGLTNPRGFTWGPDGALYVALAGKGGDSGQVVKIENGKPTVVADKMGSDAAQNGSVEGVATVSFLGKDMYLLEQGAGAAHKHPEQATGVYKVGADGKTSLVADLGDWISKNLTKVHGANGDLYDMIAGADALWVVAPNPDAIIKVAPNGSVNLVADLFKASGKHEVVTGLAVDKDGNLFVGTLSGFPFTDGSAKVFKVTPAGQVSEYWKGLTAVVSLAIGPDGKLYALEMTTGNSQQKPQNPGTGKVVRMKDATTAEDVQTGINFPISMRFGADGGLYVAGPAVGASDGSGWITKLSLK